MTARPGQPRGVSLVEALVALAVMAFGMLAMVGVQATLRVNADIAKQRAEAVRIAQEAIEDWRAFSLLAATVDVTDYADIITDAEAETVEGINATYSRTRTVTESVAPRIKSLVVDVAWQDRSNQPQSVRLSTSITGIAPELAGSLAIAADGDPVRRPQERHRGIPVLAKDLGDGTSAIKPPGAPATVAWLFDNATGVITLCGVDPEVAAGTSELTRANLQCTSQNALLVSGFVRYALTDAQPFEEHARNPQSDPVNSLSVSIARSDGGLAPICYSHPFLTPSKFTLYNCAVPVLLTGDVSAPTWSGTVSLTFSPTTLLATSQGENSASKFKVCSYAKLGDAVGTANFTGGTRSMVLTSPPTTIFRAWSAGSRIDLVYDARSYVYTVDANVPVAAPGEASQTVPVREALTGTGEGLSAVAFADLWPYTNVAVPLVNQNYLVIRAGNVPAVAPGVDTAFTCPASTIAHQPAS